MLPQIHRETLDHAITFYCLTMFLILIAFFLQMLKRHASLNSRLVSNRVIECLIVLRLQSTDEDIGNEGNLLK